MYLLYESLYGVLVDECGESTSIIGLYETEKQAIEKANEFMKKGIENHYVLDVERDNIERDNYVRLFYYNQENWSDYYEILIKKIELIKEEK